MEGLGFKALLQYPKGPGARLLWIPKRLQDPLIKESTKTWGGGGGGI